MCNEQIKNIQIDRSRLVNKPGCIIRGNETYFSYEKVRELLAMACEDIYPNGRYSDTECCMWGDMRSILCYENLKDWNL